MDGRAGARTVRILPLCMVAVYGGGECLCVAGGLGLLAAYSYFVMVAAGSGPDICILHWARVVGQELIIVCGAVMWCCL